MDYQSLIDKYKQDYAGTPHVSTGGGAAGLHGSIDDEVRSKLADSMLGQQKKGHGALDLIPGLVGTLGAIGGGALGTLAAPVAGTAVGGIAGAGAGQALGKVIENKLTGEKDDAADLGKQALYGAGGQVLGGVAGKVLSGAAGSSGALESAGAKTIASQANVTRTVARNMSASDVAKNLANYGVTNIDHYAPVAEKVTGQSGIISKLVRQAVSKADNVDTGGVLDVAKTAAASPEMAPGRVKPFMEYITKGLTEANGGARGSLNGANPLDTFDFIKSLQGRAASLVNGKAPSMITAEDKALSGAYRSVADELQDRLFTNAGADGVVADGLITPKTITQLQELGKSHPGINANKWQNFIQDVMGAKTVGDLRSVQSPFVRGSLLAAESAAGEQAGQTLGGAFKGAARAVPSVTDPLAPVKAALESNAANSGVGKTLYNVGTSKPAQALSGIAAKAKAAFESPAGQRLKTLLQQTAAGNAANNQPDDFSSPQAAIPGQVDPNAPQDPTAPVDGATEQPPASGYTDDQIRAAIQNDVQTTGGKNITTLESLLKLNASTRTNPISTQQSKDLQKIQGAESVVAQIAEQFSKAGAQGRVGGAIAGLAGKAGFSPNVEVYNSTRAGYLSNIARALGGETGNMSNQDVQRIDALLPRVTDTHQEAALKLAGLNQMIAARKAAITSVPGGSGGFSLDPSQVTFQ